MEQVGRALELAHMVNAEYGLSDRNQYTDEFVKNLFPNTKLLEDEDGYLWYMLANDEWGYRYMIVLSYYLYEGKRTAKAFIKLQKKIESVAISEKVKYIEQGSHLNPKVNDILVRFGYKHAILRKEIKWGVA